MSKLYGWWMKMMGSVAKSKLGEMRFAKNDQKWNDNYREYKLSPEQLAEVIEKYGPPTQALNHFKSKWYKNDLSKQREWFSCNVSGCKNQSRSSGLCTMHYQRKKAHGNPDIVHRTWEIANEQIQRA